MPVLPLVGSTTTLPGPSRAVALGGLDHREADAVLDAAAEVRPLELGPHLGTQRLRDVPEPHDRSFPDEIERRSATWLGVGILASDASEGGDGF
jgi:hypothetical protein